MRLTDLSVRKLKPPPTGRKIYFDDALSGFGVRVSNKSKTYVVLHGTPRRYKSIGRYPDLGLADARVEAMRHLSTKVLRHQPITFHQAVALFLKSCETHNRPSTAKSYQYYLKVFNSKKKVSDISRHDIQVHLRRYEGKPSGYNHSLTIFKIFFNWCIQQEYVDRNPVVGEKSIRTPSRDRVLYPEEIRKVWNYHFPAFSTILKVCLLTGQRRSEIASVQHEWIENDLLTIPHTVAKNRLRHTIPVSDLTQRLLSEAPFGDYGKPWNGWSRGKKRIDLHVDIPHWTLHDLRRTFSTIHAEIGTPIHITERLLNHATGATTSGVAGIYNRYNYLDEMREHQVKYETFLLKMIAA